MWRFIGRVSAAAVAIKMKIERHHYLSPDAHNSEKELGRKGSGSENGNGNGNGIHSRSIKPAALATSQVQVRVSAPTGQCHKTSFIHL